MKIVTQFVLDVCHLGDTCCDLLVHWPSYLQMYVNGLAVEIEGPIKHIFIQSTFGFLHKILYVLVLHLKGLQNREKVSNITCLEWEIFVQEEFFIWQNLNHLILILFITLIL